MISNDGMEGGGSEKELKFSIVEYEIPTLLIISRLILRLTYWKSDQDIKKIV